MSRFELGGKGDPIPLEALPDAFTTDAAPLLLRLEDGVDFIPAVYTSFGFTHYEAWCIGASGGRGGEAREKALFTITYKFETVPSSLWNSFIEVNRYYYGDEVFVGNGTPGYPYGGYMPIREYVELLYPEHQYQVQTYSAPVLKDPIAWGGGAGGGGLHVTSGRLEDLPEAVPVYVGQVGADGNLGHKLSSGSAIPNPLAYLANPIPPAGGPFWNWQARYPLPNPSFLPPQAGADGGVSSFGDVCVASGGKGGRSAVKWVSGQLIIDGVGGEGGIGGQSAAGGGALGGTTEADAPDGTWDGEIGQGGGGGRGGAFSSEFFWDALNQTWHGRGEKRNPGNGGQGSFSYADTSVFGARQRKQPPITVSGEPSLMHTGVVLTPGDSAPPITYSVLPGSGGGARAKGLPFGSYAVTYSPNGLVLLRLYKVIE